jgi:hypothetical protein
MKKSRIKNIAACIVFCVLTFALIGRVNDIVVSKKYNRYYMMEKILEERDEAFDVQVFGACHGYTSFYAPDFEEKYGISAYDMGNPGELIPTTYLRMLERFKKDTPEVAMVEIWGINAYETYSAVERVFEFYMPVNVERLPLSVEKIEVIQDFYSLDLLLDNFAIAKYKDRIMDMELTDADFAYSFAAISPDTSDYIEEEMKMRIENNGFCIMPMWHDSSEYDPYLDVTDFYDRQPVVGDEEKLELEADMLKYVDKIISLCEEKGVKLIFYRAPYLSRANELRKANWFADYCADRDVLFLDLEKEIKFNLETDFLDYHHLNDVGAEKATDFLAPYILEAMKK